MLINFALAERPCGWKEIAESMYLMDLLNHHISRDSGNYSRQRDFSEAGAELRSSSGSGNHAAAELQVVYSTKT